jgi:hypothetical protein
VAFRVLCAGSQPNFRTISDFRRRHLEALAGLFLEALRLCQRAGLVKLGHVAIDGTKIGANASKHKAMSYGRMQEEEARLKAELKQAQAADEAEDAQHGAERRGDELPRELAHRESRLKKIQEAKAALEAETRAAARAAGKDEAAAVPAEKAQRNFTDPESRILPAGAKGWCRATMRRRRWIMAAR